MMRKTSEADNSAKTEGANSVDDSFAKFFPNAYVQKIREKIFEAYSKESRPQKASIF